MNNNVVAKHILDVAVGLEKKSKNELITELSDIFDNASKIDLNSKENIDSLKNLAKAFEAIFSKAGNKSIDFEDIIKMPPPAMFAEMGKIAATSFWDAWNSVSGVASDIATAGLEENLKQLKLEQANLKRERTKIQAEINKKVTNKEKVGNLTDFDDKNVKSLNVEGDIIQKAKTMYNELRNTAKQLNDIGKQQGQDSQEYVKALYEAQEVYYNMYRMRKTLQKTETKVPESIRAAYGLLEYDDADGFHVTEDRMAYEEKAYKAGKNPVIPFFETNAGEFIGDRWERFAGTISKSQEALSVVESKIAAIDTQIVETTKAIQAAGGAIEAATQHDNQGLKTVEEIEEAYKRIRVENEKRIDDRQAKHIKSALEFDPNKSREGIKTLYDQYQSSRESGNWIEEYRALLKYVRLYESYLTTENKAHSNKITKKNNPFTPLYEQLKPMADNAQNMLQNVLNMGEGKALVGMGGVGKDGTGGGPTSEDAANAQKIREEAEAKVKAEKEAMAEATKRLQAEKETEEALKRQRIEEEKIAKAQEKAAAAREKELGLMQAMDKFQGAFEKTDKKNEALAFVNTQTGNMSELFIGDSHEVTMEPGTSRAMSKLGYDMEVHSHPSNTATPSDTDFESWLSQLNYIKKFGIIAGEELLTFDFSKLDPSQLINVIEKYKDLDVKLREQAQAMSPAEQEEAFNRDPAEYREWMDVKLRQGLEEIFKDIPGVMKSIQMPKLSESVDTSVSNKTPQISSAEEVVKTEAEAHKQNTEAIKEEIAAQEKLNDVQKQGVNVDDEDDDLRKENGALEDKLELLQEISEQYGNTITQKQRDRYEELNQKDMNEGLTPREDERYWELGEQIEEADQALEEFGNTYDKIIVKLANGKNVEILPDDKGLRTLAKIDEEYGESYNGVEIDDVVFERVKQEAVATEQAVDGLNESLKKTQQLMSGGGTGDASLADLEAERMKSESLQNELDNKIGALSAAYEEKEALQNDLESATDLNERVSKELLYAKEDLAAAERRANESEDRANKLRELLELPSGDSKSSANIEELRTLLTSIVYNTKIADDAESKYGSLALESTLQEVKNVLDSIDSKTVVDDSNGSSSGDAAGRKNPYLLSDANGKALTIYRGTRDSFGGFVANRTGTFGTDNLNIAKGYTHGDGKIFAYNAEMRKPLEIQAKGAQLKQIPNLGNAFEALSDPILKELRSLWSQITTLKEELKTASGFDKEVAIPNKIGALQKRIQEISEDENHVYGVGGTDLFARKAKKNGYDGVIFRDLVDPSSATPPSERVPSNIVVTFDEKQMHLLETFSVTGNEISKIDNQDDVVEHNEPQVVEVDNSKGASYALESTLQIVKGVLDNIQTNTSKIRTSEASNVDTIAGTALDGRLAEIKSVLESIDNKIAKGGAITTRGAVKQAAARHVESEAQTQATQSNMMKSLTHDYKTLGKLSAQFASDNNLETKAMLDNLKEEIARKRQSLNLTMEENVSLREKYSIAFDAEKRLLDAAMAQKEIDDKNKASAKEAETAWKKQVKDAKRATGINAANNAVNTGDQTVIRAIGTDGISKDIENKAKKLSNQIKALRMLRDEIDKKGNQASNADRNNLSKQIVKVKELKSEMDGYLKLHEKYSGEGVTDLGKANNFGAAGTTEYWNNITAAIKNAATGRVTIKGMNADTGELSGTTKIAANTFAQWSAVVDPLTGRLSMLRTGVKKTETLLESITRKTKEIFTYFSGSSIIFKVFNELKKGVQYVREIDVALTELKKVTDETEESYDRFLKTAAKTGERLGSTISAVTEATATFAKLGYTMEQSMEMAEAAIVYKNVGDNITSTEDAADSIISTLKGFGLEASQAMDIVDKFNEVGNRFAITSQGIGEALRLSASALSEGGNSLDESIAIITAANEVVNDPSSVGTALKTLTLRLRGAKTELEEMGEDVTGMATTTSQLQAKLLALTGGKVDIMLDENTFKNSTQILREMAAAWEDMNDIQRASALELMGGKRQANVLSALISNFDTVESAIEVSANSSGSALKENERYLDSIQGKIDQFNNAVQTLWSNTLDSDVVKFLIDLATKIVKIVDEIGPLKIAIVGLVTFLEKKYGVFSNFFNPAGSGAQEVARQVDETFDAVKVKRQIGGKKGAITRRAKKLESEGKTFAEIQEDPKIKQWTQEIKDSEQAIDEYNASIQRADETLRQSNATTVQATATERAHTTAETAGVGATNASAAAEAADTAATTNHTAATWADVLAESNREGATIRSTAATASQVLATKLANSALIQNAINLKLATVEEVKNMSVTQLLALGFKGLAVSIWSATKAILAFLFTNPIGWIILAVTAVAGAVAGFLKWGNTAKNLQEDLSNLKSEIADIKSEIESLNGELETTRDRMAELLAKDSLTFTEKEELENLQKQNDLLEREIYLLEQREKRKQQDAQDTFDDLMDKNKNLGKTRDSDGDGEEEVYDKSLERKMGKYKKWIQEYEDAKQMLLENEKNGENEAEIAYAKKMVEKAEKKLKKWRGKVDEELDQYFEYAADIDYASADPETRKYLDYIYNTGGKLSILSGDDQAKSTEIKRIFNKSSLSGAKNEIDDLVKQLAEKPDDATIIAQISEQCKVAEKDLQAVGLSVQDAADYFTKLGTDASFETLEGKFAEIDKAGVNFKKLLEGETFKVDDVEIGLADLFDEEGKIIQTKLSQVFRGTSEQTREDITSLLEGSYEQIQNGTADIDKLLAGFGVKATQQVIAIQNAILAEQNLELFPDLKDQIDGIIDKFDEFATAIGSVVDAMDTLEQARAEEAYSGSVSIETLENLMKYTDNYADLIKVDETGAIKLATNAEELLVEQRIAKIKADAQAAVQTAQATLAQAKYNQQSTKETGPIQAALATATNTLSGAWAYLSSLISDVINLNFDGILTRAENAYNAKIKDVSNKVNVSVSVSDAEKALNNALAQQEIANALTPENIKGKYDSDSASGGNKTKEEIADNIFQREMDYWENRIAANQAKYEQVQNEIGLLEAKGQKADTAFYEELIALENERMWLLEQQKAEAQAYLGTLEEGSEEWWEVANAINDIEGELDDVTASILDLQDAMAEIDAYKFEELNNRLDNLANRLESIRDLIAPNGEEDWFDDEGNWTEAGVAVLGAHIQELEFDKEGLAKAQDELNKYSFSYEGNQDYYEALGIHSEQEYYDKVEELTDQQYQYLQSINETEQSIVDMYESSVDAVEEYIDTLIDGYNDYIDSVKEALDAERDLYDFKKNIQKQAKDIAEMERRIASLSGSTNKADIAERRKLEAQLYESRESLNNTYYDHAQESQQNALDAEAEAYEEQMNRFVEGLRVSLEEATVNMDEFLMGVTTMVMYNADTVLAKYEETNLPLTEELTNPWEEAKKAVGDYSGNALELMNQWTKDGGFFSQFSASGTANLTFPWGAGTTAANTFKNSVSTVMDDIVDSIRSNVSSITSYLGSVQSAYNGIISTAQRAKAEIDAANSAASAGVGYTGSAGSSKSTSHVDSRILDKYKLTSAQVLDLGYGPISLEEFERLLKNYQIKYSAIYRQVANMRDIETASKKVMYGEYVSGPLAVKWYAKGTTGIKRDQWAITDEPQFGDELVLIPTEQGNLSYMRKGTGVIPADLTANLMEWGQFTPDSMNLGGGVNVNMINNAVIKPQYDLSFDSLVHVDNCSQETLKDLEKMVDNKIDRFSKELNYSIKRFAR